MKTQDLFKLNRSSQRLNEGLEKFFGKKINLESFSLQQLEDARNKLRTQVSQIRTESGFNENLNNDAFSQAQWILDAINAEIAERSEFVSEKTDTQDENSDNLELTAESVTTGENMTKLHEGEIQQASAIVTAKTMVDRVGRWIEELSGMENDTLLQLGDQIRDEMGSVQAKQFISTVAPAIQQALDTLKQSRETLSTGVRTLTGEEQPAEMLGAERPVSPEDELGSAEPDSMNMGDEEMGPAPDEFAAAEPAAGGLEAAGRAKRESIEFQNSLLKVLAG